MELYKTSKCSVVRQLDGGARKKISTYLTANTYGMSIALFAAALKRLGKHKVHKYQHVRM